MLRTFEINEEVYRKFKSTCDREGEKVTKKIASMVESYVKEHGESNNPQTSLDTYDKESVMAVPTIYEGNIQKWERFYQLMNPDDFKEFDSRLNWLLSYHNKQSRNF